MAAVGAAGADRQLVADQLAAAAGENRWPFNKACPVLLVALGGEPPDAPAFREHAAEDCDAAVASGIGGLRGGAGFGEAVGREGCLRNRLEKGHFWGLLGRETLNRPLRRGWQRRGPKLGQNLAE